MTIGDLGKVVTGKTPSTKNDILWNGSIPFITPKDIQGLKHIVRTERTVTQVGANTVKGSIIPPNAICVSCIGNIGYAGMTTQWSITNQQINSIIVNKENDANFVYYLIRGLWKFFKNYEGQSTTLSILNKSQFSKIEVEIPSLEKQKKIAAILSSIDAKIEVNQKINDNLQQQAQAIYSSMFIDNPNPAWKHGHLSDLITVKYGKDHKKLADGIYPVYGSGGIMRYAERPLYNKESVLIPRKGTLNNVIYVNQPFWSVDTMFYTEMKIPNVAKFVYHFVKAKDLASMNAGSAVPSMTTDILNAMEVVIPSAPDLEEFESLVAPMYKAMEANHVQSQVLSRMRDTLLPKLMSGEMDVSAVQL